MKSQLSSDVNRVLRKNQTPWEAKLWRYLRGRRFFGFKFKRQLAVGKFIFDFGCDEKRLLVELDGSGHTEIEIKEKDENKENYAISQKYKILRFWNNDIDKNLEGVLETIKNNLEK